MDVFSNSILPVFTKVFFLPQISYVRKVGTNELLKAEDKKNNQKSKLDALKGEINFIWFYNQQLLEF